MLGYCKGCDKLVTLLPGERKCPPALERWWYPVKHDKPAGGACDGDKRGI